MLKEYLITIIRLIILRDNTHKYLKYINYLFLNDYLVVFLLDWRCTKSISILLNIPIVFSITICDWYYISRPNRDDVKIPMWICLYTFVKLFLHPTRYLEFINIMTISFFKCIFWNTNRFRPKTNWTRSFLWIELITSLYKLWFVVTNIRPMIYVIACYVCKNIVYDVIVIDYVRRNRTWSGLWTTIERSITHDELIIWNI